MQSNSLIRFTRSCPTCGRRIQIRGTLLGREVACPHCNAKFTAMATDDAPGRIDDAQRLLDRVDTMLSKVETPPVVS
ncbi:response regulator [Stieleria sp. JC731]|uniref:response regulator n=1 Tax=Pirellulaceae TaxID=2691357 RepID=UPI001E41D35F|nr:response regulator [Stieleria sp. JC731]